MFFCAMGLLLFVFVCVIFELFYIFLNSEDDRLKEKEEKGRGTPTATLEAKLIQEIDFYKWL